MVVCLLQRKKSTGGKPTDRIFLATSKTKRSGWIPQADEYFARCPWLQKSPDGKKFTCDIYDDRPEDCRHYPVDIAQMVHDDCEMLERRDLLDLKRAQKKLDEIMIDSRPPAGQWP